MSEQFSPQPGKKKKRFQAKITEEDDDFEEDEDEDEDEDDGKARKKTKKRAPWAPLKGLILSAIALAALSFLPFTILYSYLTITIKEKGGSKKFLVFSVDGRGAAIFDFP